MKNYFIKVVFIAANLLIGCLIATAQNFTHWQAASYPYSPLANANPSGTSNHAGQITYTGFGTVSLYVSSLYSADPIANPGQFMVIFTDPSDPTDIKYQNSIQYWGCTDIEVGHVHEFSTKVEYIPVSYYRMGVGHFIDFYEITNSTTNPIVLSDRFQLSTSRTYGRISMDSDYHGKTTVLAWHYPGIGIQTAHFNGHIQYGQTTLAGTQNCSNPDITITRPSLNGPAHHIQYVYQNTFNNTVTVSLLTTGAIATAPPNSSINPGIDDVMTVPANISRPNLDGPNSVLYGWAYTYTDGKDVVVRLRHQNTWKTIIVNNGSLGNMPANQIFNAAKPDIFYGEQGGGGVGSGGITVGWYCSYVSGGDSRYIAVEFDPVSETLINSPDYMGLPYSTMAFTINPGISFAKFSAIGNWVAYQYLYTTYIKRNANNQYELMHAFHKWNNSVFNDNAELSLEKAKPTAFPNPFNSYISKNIIVTEDAMLQLNLTDVTGRTVAQYNENVTKGDRVVHIRNLDQLLPGTYYLTTSVNNERIQTEVVLKR